MTNEKPDQRVGPTDIARRRAEEAIPDEPVRKVHGFVLDHVHKREGYAKAFEECLPYMDHKPGCAAADRIGHHINVPSTRPCTCGLSKLIAP